MTKYISILLLLIQFSLSSFSQNSFTISGKVVETDRNNGLDFATVRLTNIITKEVKGAETANGGDFIISNVDTGSYFLKISTLGYVNYTKKMNITSDMNVGKISMTKTEGKEMKSAVIVGEKSVTSFSADKKTYNVEKDITAAGGSAVDVMKNVPGVSIDPVDNTLAIRGSTDVTLLIDGKPSAIFGNDVPTALQNLSGSSIESVEIINNPGAKYDAQGKGGIVNIVLKKDRKPGYNGNIGANIGYPNRESLNVGLNANVKKWNIFVNANVRASQNNIKEKTNRNNYINDTTNNTNIATSRNPRSGFINFGADYQATKNNKFSISENFFGANMHGDATTNFTNNINYAEQISRLIRENIYTGKPRSNTTTFGYKHNFKTKDETLNVDASYGRNHYQRTSILNTDYFNQNDSLLANQNILQNNPVKGGNNTFNISTDYVKPLNKNTKIELGVKFVNLHFYSKNTPTKQINNGFINIDSTLLNDFYFNQNTYSAYTNFKQTLGKFNYQAGLRYEYFSYDGFINQTNTPVSNTFKNLFPSLFLGYKLDETSDVSLNYTRRVNRPNFFQLVPYKDVSNPQDTSVGNPNLKPENINAVELSYNKMYGKKNSFLGSIYYQYTEDLIQKYKRFNANGTTFTQTQNLTSGITYGAEINVKHYFTEKLDASLNVNIFNNYINSSYVNATANTSGASGFAKIIANYKIKKNWDAQASANYQARAVVAQGFTKPYSNIDLALKHIALKGSLTLTLATNDIFNTSHLESIYSQPNLYYQYNFRKTQTQQISIGAQYRFLSKNAKQSDVKEFKGGRKGNKTEEKKDVKSRDENLKKDEGGGDEKDNAPSNNVDKK